MEFIIAQSLSCSWLLLILNMMLAHDFIFNVIVLTCMCIDVNIMIYYEIIQVKLNKNDLVVYCRQI